MINDCCVCGGHLVDDECEVCSYQDLNAYGHSRAKIILKLRDKISKLEKALKPFAHDDLCIMLGGCSEELGGENIIYQRNKAVLKLKHFKKAKGLLK